MLEDRQESPSPGSLREVFRRAVAQAVRAPSILNTQPWLFRFGDSHVDVLVDRSRQLKQLDRDGRALAVSCGAAAFHLRTALACESLITSAEVCPDPALPDLLVRVGVRLVEAPSELVKRLGAAIPKRATNRGPFLEMPVPDDMVERFKVGAAAENAWFLPVASEEARVRLIALVMEADHWQWEDAEYRKEVAAWLHSNQSDARDGIRGADLALGDVLSRVARLAVRAMDLGEREATHDRDLADASPLLAVVGTAGDRVEDWVHAGMAHARVLLEAADEGLATSYLNSPMEVGEVRDQLLRLVRELGGHGHPQVVLRFGYAPVAPASNRRPIDEVIIP